jgi:NADH-quinone oxidoreductase subunit L
MTTESVIILNLLIYLFGFGVLLSLRNTILKEFAGWISLIINILGIISCSGINLNNDEEFYISYPWISIGNLTFDFGFLLDNQSYFMYFLIQIISFFIQLFSTKYLNSVFSINRFFAFINLFVFSMLGLVLAINMVQLYVFWELVGFCSYLLIGFWYQKKSANSASLKAFLVNRVGDTMLMTGIFLIYNHYQTLDFYAIKSLSYSGSEAFFGVTSTNWAIIMLFGGVMAKSAQFPLQTWLPDAMEGPTPASALIHAATMVVAGVFLLGRVSPLISEGTGFYIALTGAITSVMAGLSASFQYDIKKVLAYSTISQLGLMVAAMGIGAVGASLFHLATHAFFKAGLFLCAGAVIHFMHHEQDMRKMGNLSRKQPVIFYSYIILALALIGVPFTSGYLSKEAILNAAVAYGLEENGQWSYKIIIPILMGITTFLTAFYVIRQGIMVFFERQEDPMEILIDSTRKTLGKTLKSFQDILNADNESLGQDQIISFFRTLGVFEFTVLGLSIGSIYFLFSSSPFNYEDVWFLKVWGQPQGHFGWIPIAVFAFLLLALMIAYNTTYEEIRRYYLNESFTGIRLKISKIIGEHFYWDMGLKKIFNATFSPIEKNSITTICAHVDSNIIEKFIGKLSNTFVLVSQAASKSDEKLIDGMVWGLAKLIQKGGSFIRKYQKGQIQLYLISLIVTILTVIIFKIFVIK